MILICNVCKHDPPKPETCRLCHLFLIDPAYNRLYGGDGVEASMADKVKNAFLAGANFVGSGLKIVSEEEQSRRLDICSSCIMHQEGTCKACGCPVKGKSLLESQSCPIKKW